MAARLISSLIVASALLVAGCVTVPMADPAADKAAKLFTVPPGKSRIYVYRNESFGGAVTMNVFLDDRNLGQTAANTYLVADVDPGPHRILSTAENQDVFELTTVANRIYYIWQEVKMGFMFARNQLQQMDEKTGQAGVLESQLATTPK
jgi:hypothetical protein